MGQNLNSGKRPIAKLKTMAKLAENIYGTTKIFRYMQAREDQLGKRPKPKWSNFLARNAEEHDAWRQWWKSPQSDRWKRIEPSKWDTKAE